MRATMMMDRRCPPRPHNLIVCSFVLRGFARHTLVVGRTRHSTASTRTVCSSASPSTRSRAMTSAATASSPACAAACRAGPAGAAGTMPIAAAVMGSGAGVGGTLRTAPAIACSMNSTTVATPTASPAGACTIERHLVASANPLRGMHGKLPYISTTCIHGRGPGHTLLSWGAT